MTQSFFKNQSRYVATHRNRNHQGKCQQQQKDFKSPSEVFGESVFDITIASGIPDRVKLELKEIAVTPGKYLTKDHAEIVAKAVTDWAVSRGATHFCHWFQPMTGQTAEKHDAFLTFDSEGWPIEKLSASQLMHGEPDASSFPHGGSRSTFEARGYTTWDITSPMFLLDGSRGKTLFIPTAFVTYHGDALDIKTPLLRSNSLIDKEGTRYMNLLGYTDTKHVYVNIGAEQEYFLIDRAFYYARPDLVMGGRTLFGSLTARNQQLEDHYFGPINERVLAFMEELDYELYRLGIPSKTRHNEVAPGQFELAPIYRQANIASDHNQLVMHMMKVVAERHDFVLLLHEKPFAGINGSGKHVNWSLSDDQGRNLLGPGKEPHKNQHFLLTVAIITEAVFRHSKLIRMSVATHGNDHRLGANEAPPSIISVFLGETLDRIYKAFMKGETFSPDGDKVLDINANQLVQLLKDNTDRNRTSPFAFTGNKFEVRAVGSSQAIGFPVTILNAAVSEVLKEVNDRIEKEKSCGKSLEEIESAIIKDLMNHSYKVVFNGDGYSEQWVKEAESRGLPNLRTSPEAITVLKDQSATKVLTGQRIFNETEVKAKYNVLLERYITHRVIEFETLISMIHQYVLPASIEYKHKLAKLLELEDDLKQPHGVEKELFVKLSTLNNQISKLIAELKNGMHQEFESHEQKASNIAYTMMPLSDQIAKLCGQIEEVMPDDLWKLPKYYDMLFLR